MAIFCPFDNSLLTGVRCYLPVALICISAMVGDMERFFFLKMYRVAICLSPFENCLRSLLPAFLQTGYLFLYSLIDPLLLKWQSLICDTSCLLDVRFASLCPTWKLPFRCVDCLLCSTEAWDLTQPRRSTLLYFLLFLESCSKKACLLWNICAHCKNVVSA